MQVRKTWVGLLLVAALSAGCSDAAEWVGAITGLEAVSARDDPRALVANDTTILSENFDTYSSPAQLGARTGFYQLIEGRGGSGKAVRFWYGMGQRESWLERTFAPRGDLYVSFYYRAQAGANPATGNPGGLDWLTMFRPDSSFYRFAVTSARPSSASDGPAPEPEFSAIEVSKAGALRSTFQNVRETPRFGTTNDGTWHHFVAHAVTGLRGYARVWIDGARVLDTRGHDAGRPSEGIGRIQLPGRLAATSAFYVDVDDLRIWTAPTGSGQSPARRRPRPAS